MICRVRFSVEYNLCIDLVLNAGCPWVSIDRVGRLHFDFYPASEETGSSRTNKLGIATAEQQPHLLPGNVSGRHIRRPIFKSCLQCDCAAMAEVNSIQYHTCNHFEPCTRQRTQGMTYIIRVRRMRVFTAVPPLLLLCSTGTTTQQCKQDSLLLQVKKSSSRRALHESYYLCPFFGEGDCCSFPNACRCSSHESHLPFKLARHCRVEQARAMYWQ